jgi:hypothetical protein
MQRYPLYPLYPLLKKVEQKYKSNLKKSTFRKSGAKMFEKIVGK